MFISDFPDLLTSDGARKVVPVKLEPELKKKKKKVGAIRTKLCPEWE